jgi:hypothetical protein
MQKVTVKTGDKVTISGSSTFMNVGYTVVHGTVSFVFYPGRTFFMECAETQKLEMVDQYDGLVQKEII